MLGIGFWSLYLRCRGTLFTNSVVPARRHDHDALRVRRRTVRLVHGRDRSSALCGLRPSAHGGCGVADRGGGGRRIAPRPSSSSMPSCSASAATISPSSCGAGPSRSRTPCAAAISTTGRSKPKRPFSVPDEALQGRSPHRTQPSRLRRGACSIFSAPLATGLRRGGASGFRCLGGAPRVAVAMYVIVDGFDLGVGILFNAAESARTGATG